MGIKTSKGLEALKPRAAIYWERLGTGRHVGARKTATALTWYARTYDPATKQQVRRALGGFDELPLSERYGAAVRAAQDWFTRADSGMPAASITVQEACARYVQALRDDPDKGGTAADAVQGYVRRFVEHDKIASMPVDKLTRGHVADWRKRMERRAVKPPRRGAHCRSVEPPAPSRKRSAASVNRNMTFLRAALRRAQADGFVAADQAWRSALKPIKGVAGHRELYLTREQRQALIDHAREDARPFLRALALLPLRVGALAALTVGDYDKRNRLLTVRKDKAGAGRSIPLAATAAALVADAARGKLPGASLFSRWDGAAWTVTTWKDAIAHAVAAAGLPAGTVAYTVRHSALTDMIAGGTDPLTAAKLAGTSIAMIQRYYGKLRQDTARGAGAAGAVRSSNSLA